MKHSIATVLAFLTLPAFASTGTIMTEVSSSDELTMNIQGESARDLYEHMSARAHVDERTQGGAYLTRLTLRQKRQSGIACDYTLWEIGVSRREENYNCYIRLNAQGNLAGEFPLQEDSQESE